jgi:hypothetical protein
MKLKRMSKIFDADKLKTINDELTRWIGQQGHDSCWFYPEIFNRLCEILNIPVPERNLPPEEEFENGCHRYRKEIYDAPKRSTGNNSDLSTQGTGRAGFEDESW